MNSYSTSIIQGIEKTVKPGPHTLNGILPNETQSVVEDPICIQVSHSYSMSHGTYL